MIDGPVHVLDDIGHLDDALIGLSKADETHALYPVWCDCGREKRAQVSAKPVGLQALGSGNSWGPGDRPLAETTSAGEGENSG